MDRKEIDVKMRELLVKNEFTQLIGPKTKVFVENGDVFTKSLTDNTEMVLSRFQQIWDCWLWVNRGTDVCLKLDFMPKDFENDVIQQLLLNP
jgi:hypothetical protein